MERRKVVIVAMNEPLDTDAHLRQIMKNAENRASRQSPRFPGLDLPGIQKEVHKNLLALQLRLHGKYMGLLDLLNYLKNARRPVSMTPENSRHYHTLAHMITLNGIYLYQYLRDEGYEPLLIRNYSLVDLRDFLKEEPLAVCLSSTFMYLDDIRHIASQAKQHAPHVPVIAGGILVKKVLDAGTDLSPVTLNWLSTFHGKVDAFVVEAQGQKTLLRLLHALMKGQDPGEIPNLALFDRSGKAVFTPRHPEDTPMDETAIRWDELPASHLESALPVSTSRGCFYRCRFCSYHRLFPRVHYKSLEVLREELRRIQRLGVVRHVRFTDDNFTADKNRLRTVLNMMTEEAFDFSWSSFARASSLTPGIVKLMKASGCEFVNMGIESGSQTVLNLMDKRLDRKQAVDAVHLLNEYGIPGEGGFIIGYPGETQETFEETIDFIEKSAIPYYEPFLFYYSKDMLVHEQREQFGLEGLGRAWRHATMDAAEASRLMGRMIERIERGYTNGLMGNWETFKLLRGKGSEPGEIRELFRLKRDLQLALKDSPDTPPFPPRVEAVLREIEARCAMHR